jgi:hypothetical protein
MALQTCRILSVLKEMIRFFAQNLIEFDWLIYHHNRNLLDKKEEVNNKQK